MGTGVLERTGAVGEPEPSLKEARGGEGGEMLAGRENNGPCDDMFHMGQTEENDVGLLMIRSVDRKRM